jgi:hypothetical protein
MKFFEISSFFEIFTIATRIKNRFYPPPVNNNFARFAPLREIFSQRIFPQRRKAREENSNVSRFVSIPGSRVLNFQLMSATLETIFFLREAFEFGIKFPLLVK